jgi:hypothetical protein
MLDFDDIPTWGPILSAYLSDLVPPNAGATILARRPKYIEDAAEILFSDVCRKKAKLVTAVSTWIMSQTVAAYHGSRLEVADIEDIKRRGLLALAPNDRKDYLLQKLGHHPHWPEAAARLDAVIHDLGVRQRAGNRAGQTHATLSRAGLVNGFNHYLTHGSEFDQHAARELLGDAGTELLAQHGRPTLITLAIPGQSAFEAANPYLILVRDMPNVVREVINAWAHWLAHPDFAVGRLEVDCGFIFEHDVPAQWIVSVEYVDIDEETSRR